VHDGWWISNSQFLTDSCGGPDVYDYSRSMNEVATRGVARFNRMVQPADVLFAATQVITVSKRFAELYARCGVRKPIVIEYGRPALPFEPRSISATGRVRLAHIGGASLHKGYNLVMAAIRMSRFKNLEAREAEASR
jgi:hypothetical protein